MITESGKNVKMVSEPALDKKLVGVRMELELLHKVMAKYGGEGDTATDAIVKALKECTKGVRLSAEDQQEICEEVKANYEKRMAERKAKRIKPRIGYMDYSKFQ